MSEKVSKKRDLETAVAIGCDVMGVPTLADEQSQNRVNDLLKTGYDVLVCRFTDVNVICKRPAPRGRRDGRLFFQSIPGSGANAKLAVS